MRSVAVALALSLAACGDSPASDTDADVPGDPDAGFAYPPPRTDVVPAIGSDNAIDIATWNVENFPKTIDTPERLADLIASMELDLVAMQEVESIAGFEEVVERLREHDGVLSSHTYGDGTYQKVGYIYRKSLLSVTGDRLLLMNNAYEFPRPPFEIDIAVADSTVDFSAIVVHLKAGFASEDRDRREAAVALLEAHVAGEVAGAGDEDVIVLGDFNEILTSAGGRAVFAPLLDAPQSYDVRTDELAQGGEFTFVPTQAMLDHVVNTASLDDELAGGDVRVPRLDLLVSDYVDAISDHLPVVVSMPR